MSEELIKKNAELKINDLDCKILNIDRLSVFNSKIENTEEMKTSIFKEEYIKAALSLKEIIKSSNVSKEANNIIAFIGERGSGKTTILKSFIESLKKESLKKNSLKEFKDISNMDFETLDIIDLSCRLEKSSIISSAIFNIYRGFLKNKDSEDSSLKKELEDSFNKLFKQLDVLLNINSEKVLEMNESFILKDSINEIIKMYLAYCKKDYLILTIDNISSIENINKAIDELRKYFSCDKLVILVSIHKEYVKNGKAALEKIGYFNNYIFIKPIDFFNEILKIDTNYLSNISIDKGENIFQQVQHILLRKFNYYIVNNENFNVLISSNLRMFINFIVFINSLSGNIRRDKILIIEYLESVIRREIGSKEHTAALNTILKCNIHELNKNLVILLSRLIIEKKENGNIDDKIYSINTYILENKFLIKEEKVSIGDIITSIEILKNYKSSEEEERFIECLKSIYTVRLLIEYSINPENIIKIIGKDYVGDYFKVIGSGDKFSSLVEINGRSSAQDIKRFFGFRKKLFEYVFEPCYDSHNYYSRLINKDIDGFDEESIYKQKRYILKCLNILSYSVINKYVSGEKKKVPLFVLCVINIDYWMYALKFLNKKIKDNFIHENEFILKTAEYIKEIVTENEFYKRSNEVDINEIQDIPFKDIDEDFIIDKDNLEFIQELDNELNKAQYLYTYNV